MVINFTDVNKFFKSSVQLTHFLFPLFANMSLSGKIITWYNKNKRELPFRNINDAYKIWLSEIILQQTRVEQGLPYYYRFAEKFPDVFSLARAKEETVLKLWQGLGYYSRGRNLHDTAKTIVSKHKGVFPSDYNLLLQLKGVGEYTAAAIASFAFNLPHAVVDGNVARVLARIFNIDVPVNSSHGKKIFRQTANEILNTKDPGLHNYALMELGALICKPQNPQCEKCPVSAYCLAFKLNKQGALPAKEKKIKVRNRYFNYLVIEDKSKLLLKQRTGKDIWKNLFDFPLIETDKPKSYRQVLQSKEFKKEFLLNDFAIENVSREFKHQLSHQTIHAVFIRLKTEKRIDRFINNKYKKVSVNDLKNKYALPRLIEIYLQGE